MTVDGRTLHFTDTGGGATHPPIVLVHGFPFHSGVWDAAVTALKTDYRVIAPDLRGFGKSELGPADVSLMSDFADDIHALLDGLKVPKVTLFGHSMGGYVVLDFVKRYANRVAGLGLVSTRPGPDSAEAAEKRLATAKKVRAEGAEFLIADMSAKVLSPAHRKDAEMVRAAAGFMTPAQPAGIAAALAGMAKRADMTSVLSTYKGPALVVTGDADELIPAKESEAMSEKLNAPVVVLHGAGHLASLEKTVEFDSALRGWLPKVK